MNEDITINNNDNEIMPVLGGRDLESAIKGAERNIDFIRRAKVVALRVTSANDWVDLGGKPFMQASGAEKIARVFGISWRIDEPTLTIEDNGHYSYTYKGEFTLNGATIEVIGSRGTQDPFFSRAKGEDKPISEIDRNDIKKAALTNLLGNGITRMLGLRGMTWEEIKGAGIDQSKTSSVKYDTAEMSEEGKDLRAKIGSMLMHMASGDKDAASALLVTYTTFVGKDGKTFKGKASLADVSEKAMSVTHDKVRKAYDAWLAKHKDEAPVEPEEDFQVPLDFDSEEK